MMPALPLGTFYPPYDLSFNPNMESHRLHHSLVVVKSLTARILA